MCITGTTGMAPAALLREVRKKAYAMEETMESKSDASLPNTTLHRLRCWMAAFEAARNAFCVHRDC